MKKFFFLIFSVCIVCSAGHAQDTNAKIDSLHAVLKEISLAIPGNNNSTQIQVGLSISVLAFGLILILAVLLYLFKQGKGVSEIMFRTVGIILMLTSCLFLIVAGYSQQQIAPVIGLLGTIAGFIFGSVIKTNDLVLPPASR